MEPAHDSFDGVYLAQKVAPGRVFVRRSVNYMYFVARFNNHFFSLQKISGNSGDL